MRSRLLRMACSLVTSENIREFLNSFDNLLTDCDGVLWNGNQPIPGSRETLSTLRKLGKKIFFVTNNSTHTRSEYVKKFHELGFEASIDEIYCTSNALANYLKQQNFDKVVYLIGTNGIGGELESVGIRHNGTGPDIVTAGMRDWIMNMKLEPEVGAVIVGLDKDFNYVKLLKAASYLRDPNCIFLASNLDDRFPLEDAPVVVPGTGSIVAAVKTAAGREPIVVGKPNEGMFEAMKFQHQLDPSRTIMVGDRLDTDILLGTNCNLKTLLVLTGISSLAEVEQCKASDLEENRKLVPDFYAKKLGDIGTLINGITNNVTV